MTATWPQTLSLQLKLRSLCLWEIHACRWRGGGKSNSFDQWRKTVLCFNTGHEVPRLRTRHQLKSPKTLSQWALKTSPETLDQLQKSKMKTHCPKRIWNVLNQQQQTLIKLRKQSWTLQNTRTTFGKRRKATCLKLNTLALNKLHELLTLALHGTKLKEAYMRRVMERM